MGSTARMNGLTGEGYEPCRRAPRRSIGPLFLWEGESCSGRETADGGRAGETPQRRD